MTCHSRPPNDLVLVRFCTLIVALGILGWLTSSRGFHHRTELVPDLIEAGSDRSVQRWSARAQRNAPRLEQAVRQAASALKRVEPRPEEDLFRRGRAPPVGLSSRRWHNEASTTALWRALDMLFVAAKQLSLSVPRLLAEARRRWLTEDDIFPF